MVTRLFPRVLSLLLALVLLAGTAVPVVAAGSAGGHHAAVLAEAAGHGHGHGHHGHAAPDPGRHGDAAGPGCPHTPDDGDHPGMAADCLKACLGLTLLSQADGLRLPPWWPAGFARPLSDGLSGLAPEPAAEPPRPTLAA